MSRRNPWDVLVVGAGPAGSVTARELARRGCRVVLVDRAAFPRAKVCGCCLNRATLAALASVGLGDLPASLGAVPLQRVAITAGHTVAEVRLPAGAAVSREAFDTALVRAAVQAGVTFRPDTNWRPGTPLADGTAAITILATGLGGRETHVHPNSRIGAGTIVPASAVPAFYQPGTIYMATGRGGYVGLVRLEDDRLDIAAALDAAWLRTCGSLGEAACTILNASAWPIPPQLASASWKGTPALTRTPAAVAGPDWFAVGDAAGYVEPFTGEGMAWAIASAAALAPIAARAVRHGSDDAVRAWTRTHHRLIRRRQGLCRVLARGLRSPFTTRLVVRLLAALPALSRPWVAALNRPSIRPHENAP